MSMLLLFGDDAAGSAPLSYDPADLPWNAGAKRYWWHFDDDPVWTGTSGGGSQATSVGDAVASLQSGSGSDSYWMNKVGGTSFIRRTDGVEIPIWAYMIGSTSGVESVTGGFTVGFCGYVSSGSIGSGKFCAGGEDSSPVHHCLAFESGGISVAGGTIAKYTATIDWTLPHSVVASAEYITGDGTLTGRIWLDGVLVLTQTGLTAGQWTRDLLYNWGGSAVWNMRSRFFAAQAFTGAGDIALIDRYLCLGADPP